MKWGDKLALCSVFWSLLSTLQSLLLLAVSIGCLTCKILEGEKGCKLTGAFHGSFRTACVVKYNYLSLQESQLVHKELEQNKCLVCDFRIFTGWRQRGTGREGELCSPHSFVSNGIMIVQLVWQCLSVCVCVHVLVCLQIENLLSKKLFSIRHD